MQNLVNRKLPYIDTFYHEVPAVVSTMCGLTVGVFDHLNITSPMNVDKRVAYMQIILRASALKKYKAFLAECKHSVKELARDKWGLGALIGLSTDDFWAWVKKNGIGYDGGACLGLEKYVDFKKYIWFELGKCMWGKHRRVYQDHLKYVCNYIVKPFCVRILRYAKRVRDMHELSKYLPPPSMKG